MKWKKKKINKAFAVFLNVTIALSFTGIQPIYASEQTDEIATAKFTGAPIVAFPGAEGGGSYTTGGRGGDVYIVTNLQDYGTGETPIEGSLRHGITTTPKEGRTIVFQVSGTIELKSTLRFKDIKNLTIAGQTAPGNGITLAGWDTNISNSENLIIRYLAFRPGATNVQNGSDSMDALWGRDNNQFIIDHSSFSWNTDETLSLYRGENGTVQWSIISESLTLSGHSKGRHGYGGISGGDKTTFHHNLYASHTSRNPRLGGGYAGSANKDHVAVVQFSNNVIYNWGFNTIYGGGFTFTNFMNNIELAGPGTRDNVENRVFDAGESGKLGGFYIAGNRINGKLTGVLNASSDQVRFSGDESGEQMTTIRVQPYLSADSTGVNNGVTNQAFDNYIKSGIEKANEPLLRSILSQAGATYPRRDAIDARIVAEVEQGLGRYINTEHEVGGYISAFGVIEDQHDNNYDTNRNGIEDQWEKKNKIWGISDAYKTVTKSGYTWLELYINGLVDMNHKAENPEATLQAPANNAQFETGKNIEVKVKVNTKSGNKVKKVAIYNGSEYVGEAVKKGSTYNYTLNSLADASYHISARVTDTKGNETQTTAANIHVNTINSTLQGEGWTSSDIGKPDIKGSSSMTEGTITVKGNGKLGISEGSISGTNENNGAKDDFQYVYKELNGDMELTAKLEQIGDVDNHAFTGLMIRDDLTDDSATAVLGLSWVKLSKDTSWSSYLAGRDNKGGNLNALTETLDSPAAAEKAGIQLLADIPFRINGVAQGYWLKLGRQGDTFYAYGSTDGTNWTKIGERTIAMNGSVYVGFAVDSNDVANDIEQLNFAKFSNITLENSFSPLSE